MFQLFCRMERLPRRRKYLEIFVNGIAPKEADSFFLKKTLGEANSNFSSYQFCSAYS